jgi:hypothetical protein
MKMSKVIFAGLLVIASIPLTWAQGRLSQPPTNVTCGMVISVPGTYTISGLDCSAPQDGVDITSSDVTIQFISGAVLFCSGCPQSGGTETAIRVYDPAGGQLSNVNILGAGGIEDYPIGISFAGVKDSQLSGISFNTVQSDIVLDNDANGDHSEHDLLTDNLSVSTLTGCVLGNSIYNSTFIGNNCNGTSLGGIGIGIQILSGNGNLLVGNTADAFSVGIELGGTGSVGAANNRLTGNSLVSNTTGVLVTPPANHNRFQANYFYVNTGLDIDEGNPSCGTDVWAKDIFSTTNQSCVH